MDTALRAGGAGIAGHLHHGCRQQAMGSADARWRPQRLPFVVPGWQAHCLPVQPFGIATDLDHAGRWKQSEAADHVGEQFAAELELEVTSLFLASSLFLALRREFLYVLVI